MTTKDVEILLKRVKAVESSLKELAPDVKALRSYFKYQDNFTDDLSESIIVSYNNSDVGCMRDELESLIEYLKDEE